MADKPQDILDEEERAWVDFWIRAGNQKRAEMQAAILSAIRQGVDIHVIQDRRSLAHEVFDELGKHRPMRGEPANSSAEVAKWWFLLGWVVRGCVIGLPDDPKLAVDTFVQFTLGTGESKGPRPN